MQPRPQRITNHVPPSNVARSIMQPITLNLKGGFELNEPQQCTKCSPDSQILRPAFGYRVRVTSEYGFASISWYHRCLHSSCIKFYSTENSHKECCLQEIATTLSLQSEYIVYWENNSIKEIWLLKLQIACSVCPAKHCNTPRKLERVSFLVTSAFTLG